MHSEAIAAGNERFSISSRTERCWRSQGSTAATRSALGRAPCSLPLRPCQHRKLQASLARSPWHFQPSGWPLQVCAGAASQVLAKSIELGSQANYFFGDRSPRYLGEQSHKHGHLVSSRVDSQGRLFCETAGAFWLSLGQLCACLGAAMQRTGPCAASRSAAGQPMATLFDG